MKIIKIDHKNNELVVVPESIDDLWHLEKIISKNDLVSGKTDRKIKPKTEGEKAIRITLFVEIQVEEVSFHEHSGVLKVNGIIVSGKPADLIELKSHQSLDIEPSTKISIKKESIQKWQIDRLKKAEKESATSGLLITLLDDEQADIVFVNNFSVKKKARILSGKQGKQFGEENMKYFDEIYEKIVLLEPKKILLAGPGFTRENFQKFLESKKDKKFPPILSVSTNDVGETGISELLKSGKLDALEKELQLSQESQLIEEFMKNISKNLAEYGETQVMNALNMGAVAKLILSEHFLMENRKTADSLMLLAENTRTEAHIISSKNPSEQQITGFGGVVAILRYKIS
jgi:protein pelota